jgi:Bacterial type II and III secretion system protein
VRSFVHMLMSAVVILTLFSSVVPAQEQAPGPPKAKPLVPLKVQIVVSRYQGEKKVSSLPYTLTVNANDGVSMLTGQFEPRVARLRTGASVPVPSMAPPKDSPVQGPMGPVQYKAIGTNIDCTAQSTDDGRFRVDISIEDTSVYSEGQTAQGVAKMSDIPSFRSFQTSNAVILKDGQSTEFTAAADRITGEVTKVDVTLTVVK